MNSRSANTNLNFDINVSSDNVNLDSLKLEKSNDLSLDFSAVQNTTSNSTMNELGGVSSSKMETLDLNIGTDNTAFQNTNTNQVSFNGNYTASTSDTSLNFDIGSTNEFSTDIKTNKTTFNTSVGEMSTKMSNATNSTNSSTSTNLDTTTTSGDKVSNSNTTNKTTGDTTDSKLNSTEMNKQTSNTSSSTTNSASSVNSGSTTFNSSSQSTSSLNNTSNTNSQSSNVTNNSDTDSKQKFVSSIYSNSKWANQMLQDIEEAPKVTLTSIDANGNTVNTQVTIYKYKAELAKLGLCDTDINRIVNGEISSTDLFQEIENDTDTSRLKNLMEASYLQACGLSYFSLDEFSKANEDLKTELKNLVKQKDELDNREIDAFLKIMSRVQQGESIDSALKSEIVAWRYTDDDGNICYVYDDPYISGYVSDDMPEYTALLFLEMYPDSTYVDDFRNVLDESTSWISKKTNYFWSSSDAQVAFCDQIYKEYDDIVSSRETKMSQLDKKIEEKQEELSQNEYYYECINSEIDYYIEYIHPYINNDDFQANCQFDDSNLEILTTTCKKYEEWDYTFGGIPLTDFTDDEEIVQMISCIVNGKGTIEDGILYAESGKSIILSSNDKNSLVYNYATWLSSTNNQELSDEQKIMKEQEIQVFNYIYNVKGAAEAKEYLEGISHELDNRWLALKTQEDQEYAKEHPYLSSVASILVTPFEGISAACYSTAAYFTDAELYRANVYSSGDVYRNTVASDIAVEHPNLAFVYSTGMSMADTGVLIGIGALTGGVAMPAISAATMGSRAYVSSLNDALDRGLSNAQAVGLAWASAVAETAMESYSAGHLLNLEGALGKGTTDIVSKIASSIENQTLATIATKTGYIAASAISQGLAEGEEEFATEILNYISDELIAGDLSNHTVAIRNYMDLGYSEDVARSMANKDFENQLGQAFLGGLVSGICFGAFSGMKTNHAVAKDIANTIEVEYNGDKKSFLSDMNQSQAQMYAEAYEQARILHEENEILQKENSKSSLLALEEKVKASVANLVSPSTSVNQVNVTNEVESNVSMKSTSFEQFKETISHMTLNEFFDNVSGSNGRYGVDQGILTNLKFENSENYEYLKNKITNEYGFREVDVDRFLEIVDSIGACTYARSLNTIVEYFKDSPELFKEHFGFDLYVQDKNGNFTINDSELMIDIYYWGNFVDEGARIFTKDSEGYTVFNEDSFIGPNGNRIVPQNGSGYDQLGDYLNSKGFHVQDEILTDPIGNNPYTTDSELYQALKERFENHEQLSLVVLPNSGSILFQDLTNNVVIPMNGNHWIKVTDVLEDGVLVSSWGRKCLLSYSELNSNYYGILSESIHNIANLNTDFSRNLVLDMIESGFSVQNGKELFPTDIMSQLESNQEMVKNISTSELLALFSIKNQSAYANMNCDFIENEIMTRFRNGENIFSGNNVTYYRDFKGSLQNTFNLNGFSKENIDVIQKSILEQWTNLKNTNPELASKVAGKLSLSTMANFFANIENMNDAKYNTLEKIYLQNKNILSSSINFGIFDDSIYSLGEDFVSLLAKYPNIAAKVISLKNSNSAMQILSDVVSSYSDSSDFVYKSILDSTIEYMYKNNVDSMSTSSVIENALNTNQKTQFLKNVTEGSSMLEKLQFKDFELRASSNSLVEKLSSFDASSYETKVESFEGKNVSVIQVDGDFNFIVHSTDSGIIRNQVSLSNHLVEEWNNPTNTQRNYVSSSYISNDNFSVANVGNNGFLMGFSTLTADNIRMTSDMDMHARLSEFNLSSLGEDSVLTAEELIDHSRRGYNEVVTSRVNPDYIVLFDTATSVQRENAYNAATQFNVPVVEIETAKILQNKVSSFESLMDSIKTTNNTSQLQELVVDFESLANSFGLNQNDIQNEIEILSKEKVNIEQFIRDYIQTNRSNNSVLTEISQILENEVQKYETANNTISNAIKTSSFLELETLLTELNSSSETLSSISSTMTLDDDVTEELYDYVPTEEIFDSDTTEKIYVDESTQKSNGSISLEQVNQMNQFKKVQSENIKSLKSEILSEINSEWNKFQIMRKLYIELNNRLHYDPNYASASKWQKNNIYNREVNFANLTDNNIICKSWANLYKELLLECGFDESNIKIMKVSDDVGAHRWIEVNVENGIVIADATETIHGKSDLANCKLSFSTIGFLYTTQEFSGTRLNDLALNYLEDAGKSWNQVDQSIGYLNGNSYNNELIETAKKTFKGSQLYQKLFKEKFFDSSAEQILNTEIPSTMNGMEAYLYFKKLKEVFINSMSKDLQSDFNLKFIVGWSFRYIDEGTEWVTKVQYTNQQNQTSYLIYSDSIGKVVFHDYQEYNSFINQYHI